ncbi:hypothetical protein FKW77_004990 [Venturia effusa]|uniref:Gylcosyl hydrolase 115 C-terminal domain-containing protein n=1 Tax=Venturia effusa TaxID=50376 RepID=A0A517LH65_9PEZI|nr:hypothetical protein FKW77_004990 [Venturia effusa]
MRFHHLVICLVALITTAHAIGQRPIITFEPVSGALALASRNQSVQIIVHEGDWIAVKRAADDLALDFGRVTGHNGTVVTAGSSIGSGGVIIVGTLGKSTIVDQIVQSGKIHINATIGQWESFTSSVIDSPIPGVSRALVIVGSDRRGSVYGLYDISEQIGVSPWYWWADVPAKTKDKIYALPIIKVQASPSVKYRGFFINDEAPALSGWAWAKFRNPKTGVAFGAEFYSHIFELLLRLRANYLWPAMWGSSFNVDDPENQKLADEYGIVMGTSHTEPMMRSTQEQTRFVNGTWEWDVNNASIKAFMLEGAKRAKPYESLYTIGMRGNHDTAISGADAIKQLGGIFEAQRQILDTVYGDAKKVPQVWALYTEVQGYYDNDGLRVPDDVTLLWADDNYGDIRRLPAPSESARSGGAGVYYHFDYVGWPRCYKWINTIQLQKTWEQMTMAYKRNAKNIWLVNVGDIKPLWASREFGSDYAKNISAAMTRYMSLVGKRKYELVAVDTYSIINYDEGDTMLAEWQNLAAYAQAISDTLPEISKPAFFELVLHPILAGGNHYEVVISAAKNVYYASQGRGRANVVADHVWSKWTYDQELRTQYHQLLNGKWDHMMVQTHFYDNFWQQSMTEQMPPIQYVQPQARSLSGDVGIAIEGSKASIPGDDRWHPNSGNTLTMVPASPFGRPPWFDIFSKGTDNFSFNVTTSQPWVTVTPGSGMIAPGGTTDVRAKVVLDWAKAPAGPGSVTITIESSTGYGIAQKPRLVLPYNNAILPATFQSGFVESDATVSMEAEHYSQIVPGTNTNQEYQTIPNYGKTLSGVTLADANAPSLDTTTGPRLECNFYSFTNTSAPNQNVTLILSPSLNTAPTRPLKYAVAIDSQTPQVIQYVVDVKGQDFPVGWAKGC